MGGHDRQARMAGTSRRPEHPARGGLHGFASPPETMSADKIAEIRKLYFETSPATIQQDVDRAIDILKTLKDEDERSKAAVFMEGLVEMRREWKGRKK
jgi:hypothetical protein